MLSAFNNDDQCSLTDHGSLSFMDDLMICESKYVNLIRAAAMFSVISTFIQLTKDLDELDVERLLSDNLKMKCLFQGKSTLAQILSQTENFGSPVSEFYKKCYLDMLKDDSCFLFVAKEDLPEPDEGSLSNALYAFIGILPAHEMYCFTNVCFVYKDERMCVATSDWFNVLHGRDVLDQDRVLTSLHQYDLDCVPVELVTSYMLADEIEHLKLLEELSSVFCERGIYPYVNTDTALKYGVNVEHIFEQEMVFTEYLRDIVSYEKICLQQESVDDHNIRVSTDFDHVDESFGTESSYKSCAVSIDDLNIVESFESLSVVTSGKEKLGVVNFGQKDQFEMFIDVKTEEIDEVRTSEKPSAVVKSNKKRYRKANLFVTSLLAAHYIPGTYCLPVDNDKFTIGGKFSIGMYWDAMKECPWSFDGKSCVPDVPKGYQSEYFDG